MLEPHRSPPAAPIDEEFIHSARGAAKWAADRFQSRRASIHAIHLEDNAFLIEPSES